MNLPKLKNYPYEIDGLFRLLNKKIVFSKKWKLREDFHSENSVEGMGMMNGVQP